MLMEEKFIRVIPMYGRTGKEVPNQYVIHAENNLIFQSYGSIIAEYHGDEGRLIINNRMANFSKTTKKYLIKYLECFPTLEDSIDEIKKAIKEKGAIYTTVDIDKNGVMVNVIN